MGTKVPKFPALFIVQVPSSEFEPGSADASKCVALNVGNKTEVGGDSFLEKVHQVRGD